MRSAEECPGPAHFCNYSCTGNYCFVITVRSSVFSAFKAHTSWRLKESSSVLKFICRSYSCELRISARETRKKDLTKIKIYCGGNFERGSKEILIKQARYLLLLHLSQKQERMMSVERLRFNT